MAMSTLKATRLADVEPRNIDWLWAGWLQKRTVTILAGMPGSGKSCFSLDIAARLTRGSEWPDGSPVEERGNALIVSHEEEADQVIRPRFENQGGNVKRMHHISPWLKGQRNIRVDDEDSVDELIELVEDLRVSLLIFDPLSQVMGSETDVNKAGPVRDAMSNLIDLCRETDCAVLGLLHLAKEQDRDILNQTSGSVQFVAASRAYLYAKWLNQGEFVVGPGLTNNAAEANPLHYALVGGDKWDKHPQLEWLGEDPILDAIRNLDEAFPAISLNGHKQEDEKEAQFRESLDWLVDFLGGAIDTPDMYAYAHDVYGFGKQKARKNVKELGLQYVKNGDKGGTGGIKGTQYVKKVDTE